MDNINALFRSCGIGGGDRPPCPANSVKYLTPSRVSPIKPADHGVDFIRRQWHQMPTRQTGLRLVFDRNHIFHMDQFKAATAQIPHQTININKAAQNTFASKLRFFSAGKNLDGRFDNGFSRIDKFG